MNWLIGTLLTLSQVVTLAFRYAREWVVSLVETAAIAADEDAMDQFTPYRSDFPGFAFGRVVDALRDGIDKNDSRVLIKCAFEVESWALGEYVGEPGGFGNELPWVPLLDAKSGRELAASIDTAEPAALGAMKIDPITALRFAWLVYQLIRQAGPFFHTPDEGHAS